MEHKMTRRTYAAHNPIISPPPLLLPFLKRLNYLPRALSLSLSRYTSPPSPSLSSPSLFAHTLTLTRSPSHSLAVLSFTNPLHSPSLSLHSSPSLSFHTPSRSRYPYHYGSARENFLRNTSRAAAGEAVKWVGWVDGEGRGAVHSASTVLDGRKYWVWGRDPPDLNRVAFLSGDEASRGDYFEVQAGVAPTQLQTFPLDAGTTLEWTEAITPVKLDAGEAHDASYAAAVGSMDRARRGKVSAELFQDMDRFMASIADVQLDEVIHRGSPFGAIFEARTGRPLAPGLSFSSIGPGPVRTARGGARGAARRRRGEKARGAQEVQGGVKKQATVPLGGDVGKVGETKKGHDDSSVDSVDIAARPWLEVLTNGTFSPATVANPRPASFMVSEAWVGLLRKSMATHGETWLHHFHIGVAAMQVSFFKSTRVLIMHELVWFENVCVSIR